jgi:hypothetical protein
MRGGAAEAVAAGAREGEPLNSTAVLQVGSRRLPEAIQRLPSTHRSEIFGSSTISRTADRTNRTADSFREPPAGDQRNCNTTKAASPPDHGGQPPDPTSWLLQLGTNLALVDPSSQPLSPPHLCPPLRQMPSR